MDVSGWRVSYVAFDVEVGWSSGFGFGTPSRLSPRLLMSGGGRVPGSAAGGRGLVGVWVSVCLAAASLALPGAPAAGALAESLSPQENRRLADLAPAGPQSGRHPLEGTLESESEGGGGGTLESGGDGGGGGGGGGTLESEGGGGQPAEFGVGGDGSVDGVELEGDGGELSGGLGPLADDEVGAADGVYSWSDGGRVVEVRRLEGAPAGAVQGAAPGAGGSGGSDNSTLGEWFVTDTGQELQLFGGVVVFFRAGTSSGEMGEVLARHGASLGDAVPIEGLAGAFLVEASPEESLALAAGLAGEPSVTAASPNWHSPDAADQSGAGSLSGPAAEAEGGGDEAAAISAAQRQYCTGLVPREDWRWSDELHHCAWHLDAGTAFRGGRGSGVDPVVDINIGDVWDQTMGQGVTVAIVDHHWNGRHEDLRDNAGSGLDTHWGGKIYEPVTGRFIMEGGVLILRIGPDPHGTAVAGIVGARDNGLGSRGVAPRATLTNFNYLDYQRQWTLVEGWTRGSDVVGVSNHSYGTAYWGLYRVSSVWWAAVDAVLASGLGGLGTVFTQAAGNFGQRRPDGGFSVYSERNNHRGVMPICAVGPDGTQSVYSSEGPNLWLCAPSSRDSGGIGIVTTEGNNRYSDSFGGTSAAAPQVAGVAALVRSANPHLTWRDVKVLLADTAQKNDPSDSSWAVGAAKYSDSQAAYSYSSKYGFGVVDAEAAVDAALSWTLLPTEKTSRAESSGTDVVLKDDTRTTELSLSVATGIDFVEHVNLELDMKTNSFRDFDITLVSPTGRESAISTYTSSCHRSCILNGMFRFATARHLGEDPNGTWKLRFDYRGSLENIPADVSDLATVKSWALQVYGHTASATSAVAWLSLTLGGGIETVVQEGDDLQVTVHLHNGTITQDLAVPVNFAKQSATNSSDSTADFSALASITIPAGSTSASATVTVADDGLVEQTEKYAVRIVNPPTGYDTVGVTPTVIIQDPPTVTITAGGDISEGDDAVFTLTASPAPPSPLPVTVTVAQSGDIGVATGTRTVTVPITGSVTVTVATADDGVLGLDGSVTATVAPGARYNVGAAAASVAVADDEVSVSLSSSVSSVAEANGEALITVSLDRPLTNNAQRAEWVRVPLSVGGGTDGVHWKLRLRAGGNTGGVVLQRDSGGPMLLLYGGARSAELVLTALPNTDAAERTIEVALGMGPRAPTGGGIERVFVGTGSVSVDIVNDDTGLPLVSVSAGGDVTEGGDAVFTVTAVPAPSTDLDVEVSVVAAGDFGVSTGTRTVTVPASGSVTLSVGTADDGDDEADGSVTVTVAPGSGYTRGSPFSASVAIADDDYAPGTLPTLSISGGADITEGGTAVFTVTAAPPPSKRVSVNLLVGGLGDFQAFPQAFVSVTMPTEGSASFSVRTVDDAVDEPDGSVTVEVQPSHGFALGSPTAASVAVADNDPPPSADPVVSVTAVGDVTEGSAAQFTVTATPAPAADLVVSVTVAAAGDFGAATGARTVTVPTSGSATLSVATTGDQTDEPDGSVTATVNSGSDYTVSATAGAATAVVADDDDPPPVVPVVSIVAVGDVTEGSVAQFTVTASPAPAADLVVSVTVAAAGDFGAATGARTVTVPTSGSATLSVATTGDQTDEPDGSVTATVNSGSDYTVSATAGAATAVVADDDDPPPVVPVVSIVAVGDVTEGSVAQFTVTASPAPAADLAVSVTVTASGEFGAPVGTRTVTIASGANFATLTVATTGDDADEPDGSVTATVNSGSDYTVSATAGAATAAVADDDPPPVIPVVSVTAVGDVTEGSVAQFTVTASPAPAADLAVSVTVTASGDFGATTGSRTVTVPMSGSATLSVATTGDQTDEPDGSVTATVDSGSDYTVSATAGAATAAVADDDPPPVVPDITVEEASATEGGILVFRILLSRASTGKVTVDWYAGTAWHLIYNRAHRSDYQPTSGTMVFEPGTTALSATVWLEHDSRDEPDEHFAVEAYLAGEWRTPADVGTMTIIDDD